MSKSKFLGEFEIVVLAATSRLGESAYGIAILNEIEAHSERKVSIGALYATLSRLEQKKLVVSTMGEATPERGGKAKKYYRLSGDGQAQLERSARMLQRLLSGVVNWSSDSAT